MPDDLGPRLRAHAADAGVRLLLIRRPGRALVAPATHRVFAVSARPSAAWAETTTFDDLGGILDLDLAALRAGHSLGLEPHDHPVFAVCTHGRHDACCAERGRPVAAALADAFPDETWEVSHMGGDRFAANMLVAPDGLYYGRLDPESALAVAEARTRSQVELDHLRGRTGYSMPVQAADIALRRHLSLTAPLGPHLVAHTVDHGVTEATFETAGERYLVRVRSTKSDAVTLTCRAARPQHALQHEVLELARL